MSPKQIEQLHTYLDGEMSSSEKEAFDLWLTENEAARIELSKLVELREQLQSCSVSASNVDTQWQEFEKLRDAPESKPSGTLITFPRIGAIAALLCLGLVLWFANAPTQPDTMLSSHGMQNTVQLVESDFEDSSPIVYLDDESGWIVIWVDEGAYVEPLG